MPLNIFFMGIVFIFSSSYTFMALKLPMGVPSMPGPGLVPLIAGVMGTLLSLFLLVKDLKAYLDQRKAVAVPAPCQQETKEEPEGEVAYPRRIIWFVIAFILYVVAFQPIGYMVSTFVFATILFKIMENKWTTSIFSGVVTAAAFYVTFTLLAVPLPAGILSGIKLL